MISQTLTLSGSISEFDIIDFRSRYAVAINISESLIDLEVTGASVLVEVTIRTQDEAEANSVVSTLQTFETPAFGTALGVVIENVTELTRLDVELRPPSMPAPLSPSPVASPSPPYLPLVRPGSSEGTALLNDGDSSGGQAGLVAGIVILCLCVVGCICVRVTRKQRKELVLPSIEISFRDEEAKKAIDEATERAKSIRAAASARARKAKAAASGAVSSLRNGKSKDTLKAAAASVGAAASASAKSIRSGEAKRAAKVAVSTSVGKARSIRTSEVVESFKSFGRDVREGRTGGDDIAISAAAWVKSMRRKKAAAPADGEYPVISGIGRSGTLDAAASPDVASPSPGPPSSARRTRWADSESFRPQARANTGRDGEASSPDETRATSPSIGAISVNIRWPKKQPQPEAATSNQPSLVSHASHVPALLSANSELGAMVLPRTASTRDYHTPYPELEEAYHGPYPDIDEEDEGQEHDNEHV